jgi:two-component system, sensor histidine kinase PdtaS
MAEDSVVSARPVEISVEGDLGDVTADVATPLAVALAEVLQNAVEHAFMQGDGPGHVRVALANGRDGLSVDVRDDGSGLHAEFDIEGTTSLGLSIVRDLVVSQLGGSISMGRAPAGGTEVLIRLPAHGH